MTIQSIHPWQGHGILFWIVVIALPCVAFLGSWGLYEVVIRYTHYSVGVLLSLFVATGSGAFLVGAFDKSLVEEILDRSDMSLDKRAKLRVTVFVVTLSTSVAAVLLLVTLFSYISYALVRAGLIEGTEIGSSLAKYSSFVTTYGWHLVDLVPGTNVEHTLGMKNPPLGFRGWLAGTPFLLFRLMIGIVGFTAIRRAWKKFTEIDAHVSSDKISTAQQGHPNDVR